MAKLVTLNTRRGNGNMFKRFFKWLKSLDPFARFMVVTLVLVTAATPTIIGMTVTNRNFAAGTGSISVNPSTGTFNPGDTFTVTVSIDGGGQAFNAASADISLTNLTVISGPTLIPQASGGCGFDNAMTTMPTATNPSFAGAILGGSEVACTLYTMTVQAGADGPASINFDTNGPNGNHIVATDGSELLNTTIPGTYTVGGITPSDTPIPSDTPAVSPTDTPGVIPTDTPIIPTDTPGVGGLPTDTPVPSPTDTPIPTSTPVPTTIPTPTGTASIKLNPSSLTQTVGSPFSVFLLLDGGGDTFNAAQATVTVQNLTVTGINTISQASGGCDMTYVTTPTATNPSFVGTTGTPLASCTLYSLTVQGNNAGTGTITVSNGAVTSSTSGINILGTVQSGSYQITSPGVTTTPAPTSVPGTGGGLGGSGGSHGPSVCTNQVPPSAPFIYEVDVQGNSATIYAVPSLDPYDSYTVSYGEALNDEMYAYVFEQGHSNGAIKFTINDLKRSVYYSFKIHSNNGCQPSAWSNSFTAKTRFWPWSSGKYYLYQQSSLRALGRNGKPWWQFW